MNILSLFDGIACGRLALERAGIEVDNYFASEVDKYAIKVANSNWPDIIQLGDVKNWKEWNLPQIDLLMGGSPCQGFSYAGKRLNFDDPRSRLFFDFVDILEAFKPKFFLLENVKMKKESQDIISYYLGVEPMEINSALVSGQNRKRLYWFNWEAPQPEDKGIYLKDIIYDDSYKNFTDARITKTKKVSNTGYVKFDLSGKGYYSQQDRAYFKEGNMCSVPYANPSNKMNIVLDYENDIYRRIHPVEVERLQTLPDGYTESIENHSKRIASSGNAWTADVIRHLLKYTNSSTLEGETENEQKS